MELLPLLRGTKYSILLMLCIVGRIGIFLCAIVSKNGGRYCVLCGTVRKVIPPPAPCPRPRMRKGGEIYNLFLPDSGSSNSSAANAVILSADTLYFGIYKPLIESDCCLPTPCKRDQASGFEGWWPICVSISRGARCRTDCEPSKSGMVSMLFDGTTCQMEVGLRTWESTEVLSIFRSLGRT